MQPDEFIAAQFGSTLKAAGTYTDQKIEAFAPNGSGGLVVSELENQDNVDVLAKYFDPATTLFSPNFIRVDNGEDKYFKKITISQPAVFILNRES